MLEILVQPYLGSVNADYALVPIDVSEEDILDLDPSLLPDDWAAPDNQDLTRGLGDAWIESEESLALRVPSSLVEEYNILINPRHPRFAETKIGLPEPFKFDQRLEDLLRRAGAFE